MLKATVGYLAAAYLMLLMFLAIYGALAPREEDLMALERSGIEGPVVLVGLLVAQQESEGARALHLEDKRYYAILPHSLSQRALWAVAQENLEDPVVQRSQHAFWAVVAGFVFSLAGFWWYWFGPSAGQPPDNSSRPTPPRSAA